MSDNQTPAPKIRTFNWEPDCFKNEAGDHRYTGHLVLKAMRSDERNKLMIDLSAARPTKADGEQVSTRDGGDWMMKIWEEHKGMILSAEVVRLKDGAKLDLEDCMYEEGLMRLPLEFAGKFMGGFGLGNG